MGRCRRPLFVLAGIFILGVGCNKEAPPTNAASRVVVVNHPDQTMTEMKLQSYGLQGLDWEMTAPRADGYTAKSKMHAENIKITFFQKGKKTTDVTANEGLFRFEGNTDAEVSAPLSPPLKDRKYLGPGDMFLNGNVVAVSTDGSKMMTQWLWFDRSKDVIFSTAAVKIVREDSITNGVGLEAKSNLSNVKIFNQTLVIKDEEKKKK